MLTDKQCRDAQPLPDRDLYLRDTGDGSVRGFLLRIRPSGERSFELRVYANGKDRRFKLGPHSTGVVGSVARARKLAHRMREQLASGIDLAAERTAKREQERAAKVTFGDLRERWLERGRTGVGRKTGFPKKTWKEDERTLARYVADWDALPLIDIDAARVRRRILDVQRRGPYAANRLGATLSAMFRSALRDGLVASDPTVGRPVAAEHARERWLSDVEAARLMLAIDAEPDDRWRTYLSLLLHLGLRCGELLAIRWSDVHLDDARIDLRAATTKTNRSRSVALAPQVVSLLSTLADHPQHGRRADGYVFASSSSESGHLVDPKRAWRRVVERAELTAVRLHDLRRTVGSWLVNNNETLAVTGAVLGHASLATTQTHYSRLALDTQRRALDAHAERLRAAVERHEQQVRPLRRAE